MRLDTEAALGSRVGLLRRFPFGPVLGITPFNFPLNLVAHKVAPALAVGAPIVVKPASRDAARRAALAELFDETDLPKGMYSGAAGALAASPSRWRATRGSRRLSFTGSSEIGWYLKGLDPKKHVTLELGGNAGVIVHSDADLDLRRAADRVRRLLPGRAELHQRAAGLRARARSTTTSPARLDKQVESLKIGDPMDPTVDVGPVIDQGNVDRIDEWVKEAVAQGAEVLTGGTRRGPVLPCRRSCRGPSPR